MDCDASPNAQGKPSPSVSTAAAGGGAVLRVGSPLTTPLHKGGGGGLKRRSPDVDGVAEQFSHLTSLSTAMGEQHRLATPKRHCIDGGTPVAAQHLVPGYPSWPQPQPHLGGIPSVQVQQGFIQGSSAMALESSVPMESSPYGGRGAGHYVAPQEMIPDLPVSSHYQSQCLCSSPLKTWPRLLPFRLFKSLLSLEHGGWSRQGDPESQTS